jgi:hypothetical protein
MKREESAISTISITTDDNRSIWARFYWSKNSGTYGHQVITEYNIGDEFETMKTGGCGFCKESQAFSDFTRKVFPELSYQDFDNLGSGTMLELIWWKNGTRPTRDVEMTIEEFKSLVTK